MNLDGLTMRQLEAVEDYLGVPLDQAETVSGTRLAVVAAYVRLAETDPTLTLDQVRDLPLGRIREVTAEPPPGEA